MATIWLVVGLGLGGALGAAAVMAWARGRLAARQAEVASQQAEVARLEVAVEHERALGAEKAKMADEKAKMADELRSMLPDTIKAAASEAMQGSHEQFLSLAGQRLAPIDERLRAMDDHLRDLEHQRTSAYSSITEQVQHLSKAQEQLVRETGNLTTALRKPHVRGQWGELSLRNAVEAAGMTAYCDFAEQVTVDGDGGRLRPDLVVRLPGGKQVVVDAKVSLDAYLDAAASSEDTTTTAKLADHARQVRKHMLELGKKSYAEQFSETPECVVMFLPLESMLSAALHQAPDLFEEAARHRVLLATPTTLLGILFAIAHVWRQESVAENAQRISETGKELYQRLQTMGNHVAKLGRGIETVVKSYNDTVGSLESRVLVTARRFEEYGAATGELASPVAIESVPRPLSAPELDDGRVVELGERSVASG